VVCVRIRRDAGPRGGRYVRVGMRLAIFSDVHGQIGRLSACLDAVARTGVDELWCLGDAVDGLSARQEELTVACVRAINDVCTVKLAGNHEAWALQDQALPEAAAVVIACWSVAAQRDGILAVHGSPHNPLMGHLSDERDVRDALRRLPGWLCAHGHTHQAALWIARSDGTIERQRRPTSYRLEGSMRAVVCPGALSGPDPCWLLVDTVLRRLTWHRIDAGWTATSRSSRRAAGTEAPVARTEF
jgi:predicted phosphodiesterase